MNSILRIEQGAFFGTSIIALYFFGVPWWGYIVLLLGPDISMIGYVFGPTTGALMYNIFHHKGVGVIIGMVGFIFGGQIAIMMGIIIVGHSSMDRMLGYGLKYPDAFTHTHLGWIGKDAMKNEGSAAI